MTGRRKAPTKKKKDKELDVPSSSKNSNLGTQKPAVKKLKAKL